MVTIVYSHPYEKSFNHAILSAITDLLTGEGREYCVIDLYADGFEPAMSVKELEQYRFGKTTDPLVTKYQAYLKDTDHIIFLFPIWWGMMPAMVKGFFDKVFLKGVIYDTTPEGALMPCLDIKKTTIISTSQNDTEVFENFMVGYLKPMVLETVGMNNVTWHNCDHTSSGTDDHRHEFIEEVLKEIAQ